MPETKPRQGDALRIPKPKKKLGLVVPPSLKMPHEDLISSEADSQKQEEKATMTSHTSQPTQTSMTSHTSEDNPVAPQRDYMKVANSIGREAVPAGLFTGKSKQLYDCLYAMTRGAIVPTRTVRISRPKLMVKAHIGSRVTFDANVDRLLSVGLITVRKITGEHEGNEYTVNLPEEIDLTMPSLTSQTTMTSQTSPAQNLDGLVRPETSQTRQGLSQTESTNYEVSKTSFKTNTERSDDDDATALADLNAVLKQASKEITGRDLSPAERTRWKELAELLITEAKIAAARTTVSSLPAFLTEHLRRRLWKKEMFQLDDEQRTESQRTVVPALSEEQIKSCPDCGGSTWYYPEGPEKGIRRCRHEALRHSLEAGE